MRWLNALFMCYGKCNKISNSCKSWLEMGDNRACPISNKISLMEYVKATSMNHPSPWLQHSWTILETTWTTKKEEQGKYRGSSQVTSQWQPTLSFFPLFFLHSALLSLANSCPFFPLKTDYTKKKEQGPLFFLSNQSFASPRFAYHERQFNSMSLNVAQLSPFPFSTLQITNLVSSFKWLFIAKMLKGPPYMIASKWRRAQSKPQQG